MRVDNFVRADATYVNDTLSTCKYNKLNELFCI